MTIKTEIIAAVAGSALIGGGTVVITTARDNSVQDTRIEALEHDSEALGTAVKELNKSVQDLDKNVAVLNERMREK